MNSNADHQYLIPFILSNADNTLILAQRNAAWCGHGPVLEQDIAITNISLDLIGQARNFYQYAASLINSSGKSFSSPVTEDTLAYLRDAREFRNCLLVEQPNGDWAQTILRQFFFSAYQDILFRQLETGKDEQMAAIAAKSLKEVSYHLRWSSEWVIRLGDGTVESHERLVQAVEALWPFTGELFIPASFETNSAETGIDMAKGKTLWEERVSEVFREATIEVPEKIFQQTGGKDGKHSEYLGYILAELQFMQRAYPDSQW
jgi:ring-1,2-phenylacetyl-CoA epoxidase subunit PaaC